MNKEINSNGFGYVDLNLPSGTLWAWKNVGAASPDESGLYFQWGDTQGYTADQVGAGKGQKEFSFNWDDYKFSIDGNDSNFSKYKTTGATLELADDAANANMGGDWHMPTPEQIQELINTANTTSTWTTQYGVKGRLFTSKKNDKSIFIPAAGYASNGSLHSEGSEADVWSSVLNTNVVYKGQYLGFYSDDIDLDNCSRCYGFSVRGVLDKSLGHKHFEPFQKVLIKEWFNSKSLWVPALYSYYNAENNRHYVIGGKWAEDEHILPYEGNEYKVGKSAEK